MQSSWAKRWRLAGGWLLGGYTSWSSGKGRGCASMASWPAAASSCAKASMAASALFPATCGSARSPHLDERNGQPGRQAGLPTHAHAAHLHYPPSPHSRTTHCPPIGCTRSHEPLPATLTSAATPMLCSSPHSSSTPAQFPLLRGCCRARQCDAVPPQGGQKQPHGRSQPPAPPARPSSPQLAWGDGGGQQLCTGSQRVWAQVGE